MIFTYRKHGGNTDHFVNYLIEALMINKRAEVILKHYEKYRSERALGFCVSRVHAEYMAKYFLGNNVKACAVYNGEGSEFSKVEDENYAFRAYLKNHADIDKLDEQFLELHNELFVNYDCSKCRNCCKEYSASFEKHELVPVADFLKIPEKEFIDKYIEENFGEYQLKKTPCCFLKEDESCEIEVCKPGSCKGYPFTDRPERLFSLISIIESTSVCPVVFEMVESLKKEYRFKRKRR